MDTNVVVAGLRSRRGASFRLLSEVGTGRFDIALSVPLVLEYEEALRRHRKSTGLSAQDIDVILDYFCSVGNLQEIFYLWRPFLQDRKDDLVLEVAVAGNCYAIVTYNRKDFQGVEQFGISLMEPGTFLQKLGVLK